MMWQFPLLETASGELLAQSQAIEKYLAKEAGLLPSGTDLEVAKAESVYQVRGYSMEIHSCFRYY